MTDDDHLDLSAWQPPAAPDVADAVLAAASRAPRMSGKAAIELPPSRGRWWIAGGAAVAIAAAVTVIALRATAVDPGPADGAIVATRAEHLELAGASVDLDPGTTLHWRHDRDGLRVDQRGAATWTVVERVRIDAGASSIEATAANLRVETQETTMNRQDLQIVGTSALTAAAVALVTVVVYDGHVRATSAGQTITIAPGATVQITPDRAPTPAPAPLRVAEDPIAPIVARCDLAKSRMRWMDLQTCGNQLMPLDATRGGAYVRLAADEVKAELHYTKIQEAVRAHDRTEATSQLDRIPTTSVYRRLSEALLAAITDPPPCDADELARQADLSLQGGDYSNALHQFELAYRCRPEAQWLTRAYLSACKSDNAKAAHDIFTKLPADKRQSGTIIQICLNQGIDPRELKVSPNPNHCQSLDRIDPFSNVPACGELEITCKPVARVYIDGTDTGKDTPTGPLEVAPGKHKVTFKVGDDRYTFTAVVGAGQTVKMAKILQ